jgi:anti-sigma factor RsiW
MIGDTHSELFGQPLREVLEQYLDGELSAEQHARVEQLLAGSSDAGPMLARIRSARAARAEALAGYLPTAAEARAQSEAFLALAREDAPAGRIGPWTWARRLTAVAAAAALVIGAFAAGRMTAAPAASTPAVASTATPDHPYTVVYWNALGEPLVRQFANAADVDAFVTNLEATQGGEVASVTPSASPLPDDSPLSREGSF